MFGDMHYDFYYFFFFQAEDGIRDLYVTGVQTCALPIYPISIVEGDIPISNNFSVFSRRAPAKTITDIVPSPTSLSTEFDASIMALAAGCTTSILRNIVEPLLVRVTSPKRSMYIFSNPRGPNELFMRSAINLPASKLYLLTSSPTEYSVPSPSKFPLELMQVH